jgi:hypothetical protein
MWSNGGMKICKGRRNTLGYKPASVLLGPSRISLDVTKDWTSVSGMKSQRPTAPAMAYSCTIEVNNTPHSFLDICIEYKILTYFPYFEQEVLGRTNLLLSLIRHGPHWKRRVQQFFHSCLCIRYRGNVSTEPMRSNDRGILPSRCLATIVGIRRQTDTHTRSYTQGQTAAWSHRPTLFFKVRK